MVYKVIGLMSGSSLDGLDIAYVHLQEIAGKWTYEIKNAECCKYSQELMCRLRDAIHLDALSYQLLDVYYGHYIGTEVNNFIEKNNLNHQVDLAVSHGHTTFHIPAKLFTSQLGDGAAIAAETGLPVVSDLRSLDVAFGGQGAPIVPVGESLLFPDYDYFLNLGGIANISAKTKNTSPVNEMIAFDICPANRILNMLAEEKGMLYDDEGRLAETGNVNKELLQKLNALDFYNQPFPKSLSNNFGTDIVFPIIKSFAISTEDKLSTYVTHVSFQIENAIINCDLPISGSQLLATGGGVFNSILIAKIEEDLHHFGIRVIVPGEDIVNYKEALIVALIGTLRWREEYNVMSSVTGAKRSSIGGALWLGTDA